MILGSSVAGVDSTVVAVALPAIGVTFTSAGLAAMLPRDPGDSPAIAEAAGRIGLRAPARARWTGSAKGRRAGRGLGRSCE